MFKALRRRLSSVNVSHLLMWCWYHQVLETTCVMTGIPCRSPVKKHSFGVRPVIASALPLTNCGTSAELNSLFSVSLSVKWRWENCISLILKCTFFHILVSLNSMYLTIGGCHIIGSFFFSREQCRIMIHLIISGVLDLMNYGILPWRVMRIKMYYSNASSISLWHLQ